MRDKKGRFAKGNKGFWKGKHRSEKTKEKIKKFWKENPEVLRKIIDATKTQITQEIVDKIINLYKKGIDGVKIAQKLHIGDKKIYKILEVSNLKYGQGKNPNSRNGFKEGHEVPEDWRQSWSKKNKGKMMGDKNPAWLGGISFKPYTPEFNKAFKLTIKQRDGFRCLKCGMREEDHFKIFNRKQTIHHIDYIKENTFEENCCVLCNRCNLEVNLNRKSWTKFFQSLLSERYGYQYTEDGKIILNFTQLNSIRKME